MKTRNQRELQKYWAKEATKKAKLAKKATPPEESSKPAAATPAKGTAKQ